MTTRQVHTAPWWPTLCLRRTAMTWRCLWVEGRDLWWTTACRLTCTAPSHTICDIHVQLISFQPSITILLLWKVYHINEPLFEHKHFSLAGHNFMIVVVVVVVRRRRPSSSVVVVRRRPLPVVVVRRRRRRPSSSVARRRRCPLYIQLYSPNGSNIKTTNNLTKHNK